MLKNIDYIVTNVNSNRCNSLHFKSKSKQVNLLELQEQVSSNKMKKHKEKIKK